MLLKGDGHGRRHHVFIYHGPVLSAVVKQQCKRHFVGAAGAISTVGAESVNAATASSRMLLTVSGYKLDRVEALIDGRVQVEGCDIHFEESGIGDINTNVFSGPQSLDVTEIGLHPFMLAYANEGFRDYSLLPISPIHDFRHKSIFIRTDHGIKGPEDLRGALLFARSCKQIV